MAIKKVFKSHISSINVVTTKGRTCAFVEGRYLTDVIEEVQELTDMVVSKSNPHIFIDENETEIDTSLQDAIKEAQREAALKVMAEFAAKKEQAGNQSQTSGGQVNPAQGQASTMNPATLARTVVSPMNPQMAALSNKK